MPDPSKIALLPEEVRAELDGKLIANGFSGLAALSEWLGTKGFEISKSAVGRHSQGLKRTLARIRTTTQAARLVQAEIGDETDDRAGATISLLQTGMFEVLQLLLEAEEEEDAGVRLQLLSQASRAVADLTRASIGQKRFAAERGKELLEQAAARVGDAAKAQGMDEVQARFWVEKVLGVSQSPNTGERP